VWTENIYGKVETQWIKNRYQSRIDIILSYYRLFIKIPKPTALDEVAIDF